MFVFINCKRLFIKGTENYRIFARLSVADENQALHTLRGGRSATNDLNRACVAIVATNMQQQGVILVHICISASEAQHRPPDKLLDAADN